MVKRTTVVLGIFAMLVLGAGISNATGITLGAPAPPQSWVNPFPDTCGGNCLPLFVPAPCPEYPGSRTIVKTWSCKIEGPCPPPGPMVGGCGTERPGQLLGSLLYLLGSIALPCEMCFGGFDGVYGCLPDIGGCNGPCGPFYGPVPGAINGVMNLVSPPPVMFGCFW